MALYRVLRSLETKRGLIRQGDFISGKFYSADSLEKLEQAGAISLLHAPPLSELPDFDGAAQLATLGIVSADQFLEADNDMILSRLGITLAELQAWQLEVSDWLVVPAPARAAHG